MRKARVQAKIPLTFKEYLEQFEPTVLQGAVIQLEGSIAWELMKAFLKQRQREFEIAALDLVKHDGQIQAAANASGYAQACEDTADHFMQDLVDLVNGVNGFVEGEVRPDQQ